MFFTQEDYRKIEQWLQRNSVKDTEFQEALPLNGLETITLVQDEHNKKVFIKDLVDQIFKLGVSDFLNVTDKYEASYITLNEAIKLIPSGARKVGQVITFLNTDGNWQVYQFKGVLNQWNQLDLWEDLFDWGKFVIDSILPDEEDLTKSLPDKSGNSYLSLKDRRYDPKDFSGLGKIILRKNIIDFEDPIYGPIKKNILYQDMLTQENTIYEIRYDFDLNGQEITIPEGCVLKFNGGSFSDGRIIGSNTYISSDLYRIFYNIKVSGDFSNTESNILWFIENGKQLNSELISSASAISRNINLNNGTFYCKDIDITNVESIYNANLKSQNEIQNLSVNIFTIHDTNSNVLLENISFDGGAVTRPTVHCVATNLLRIERCLDVVVRNCEFKNYAQSQDIEEPIQGEMGLLYQSDVNINNNHNVTFESNILHDNYFEQVIIYDPTEQYSLKILNCTTYSNLDAYGTFINFGFKSALYSGNYLTQGVASFIDTKTEDVTIVNNYFNDSRYFAVSTEWTGESYMNKSQIIQNNIAINCRYGAFNTGVYNVIISNNIIESCGGRYGSIYCKGKCYGEYIYAVQSAITIPYDKKPFDTAYNIIISDNIIRNDLGNSAISIKSHSDRDVNYVAKQIGMIKNITIKNNYIETKSRAIKFIDINAEYINITNNKISIPDNMYAIFFNKDSTYSSNYVCTLKDISITHNTIECNKVFNSYVIYSTLPAIIENFIFSNNCIKNPTSLDSLVCLAGKSGGVTIQEVKDNSFPYCCPILKQANYLYKGNKIPTEQKHYNLNGSKGFFVFNYTKGDNVLTGATDGLQRLFVVEQGTEGSINISVTTTVDSNLITTQSRTLPIIGSLVNISDGTQGVVVETYNESGTNYIKLNTACKASGNYSLTYQKPTFKNIDGTYFNKVMII